MSTTALAENYPYYRDYCMEDEFISSSCKTFNCIMVDFSLINGNKIPQFVVGDYFYYNITLYNLGNSTIDDKITISVFDPKDTLLDERTYNMSLNPFNSTFLFPFTTLGTHRIYNLDLLGVYKLNVMSEKTLFFRFYLPQCNYVYSSPSINYTFDTTPTWQYLAQKSFDALISEQEKALTVTTSQSQVIINLTYALVLLSIVLAVVGIAQTEDIVAKIILAILMLIVLLYVLLII
jgi:hypothetical protein